MARTERRKLKNDAEYAAASVAPNAQQWYDHQRDLMGKNHEAGGMTAKLWQELLQDETANLGHLIQTSIGAIFTKAKHNVTNPQTQLDIGISDPQAVREDGEAKRRYREFVSASVIVPPDTLMAGLLGLHRSTVSRFRSVLEREGYKFSVAELPEWAYQRKEIWWKVQQPPTEAEIMSHLTHQLTDRIKSLGLEELKTLAELLSPRNGANHA